jgi:hypothetical protein
MSKLKNVMHFGCNQLDALKFAQVESLKLKTPLYVIFDNREMEYVVDDDNYLRLFETLIASFDENRLKV